MTRAKTTSLSELERLDRADAERELAEWATAHDDEARAGFEWEDRIAAAPRPCEDGLVEADPIDWRRDRDEDRLREQERWDEGR